MHHYHCMCLANFRYWEEDRLLLTNGDEFMSDEHCACSHSRGCRCSLSSSMSSTHHHHVILITGNSRRYTGKESSEDRRNASDVHLHENLWHDHDRDSPSLIIISIKMVGKGRDSCVRGMCPMRMLKPHIAVQLACTVLHTKRVDFENRPRILIL